MKIKSNKQFTDRNKWRDEWFLELSKDNKLVWIYLCDNCTKAGRWKKSVKDLNFRVGVSVDEAYLLADFCGRVFDYGAYLFIPKYLLFQYPNGLNSNKPAIKAVRTELHQHGLVGAVQKLYGIEYLDMKPGPETGTDAITTTDTDAPIEPPRPRVMTPQGMFMERFKQAYELKTGAPFLWAKKDFVLVARLIAEFGLETVAQKTLLLADACERRTEWFTRNEGWKAFTIGTLQVQWNKIIINPGAVKKSWEEIFKQREASQCN